MTTEHRRGMIVPGTQLGHYQIISMLGAGGMGEVYLAQDLRLGRKVAVARNIFDVTGEICTRWNERESTWRKSGSCQSRGTNQSRS
jgi:hypothetical protein